MSLGLLGARLTLYLFLWSGRGAVSKLDAIQINIKGEQETENELYRVADVIDQPLGETLKRALAALVRELATE